MKRFTEKERRTVRKIIDLAGKDAPVVLGNLLFDFDGVFSQDSPFYFEVSQTRVQIKIDLRFVAPGPEALHFVSKNILFELSFLFKLLDFLREHDYIIVHFNQHKPPRSFGFLHDRTIYANYNFLSQELQSTFLLYSEAVIVPHESLSVLAQNDFKDEDTLRYEEELRQFQKNFKISKLAVAIAGISALISAIALFFSLPNEKPTEIEGKVRVKIEDPSEQDTDK